MATPQKEPHPLSPWASFIGQLVICIFWGAYFTFQVQNNNDKIQEIIEDNIPTRTTVIETRLEYYDKTIVNRIEALSEDVNELKLEVRGQRPHANN